MRRRLWISGLAGLLVSGGVIAVTTGADAATTTYQAESAQLSGGARTETEHAGYTGSGYVGGFVDANRGNAAASFTVNTGKAGSTTITFRYANGTGSARTMSLFCKLLAPPSPSATEIIRAARVEKRLESFHARDPERDIPVGH